MVSSLSVFLHAYAGKTQMHQNHLHVCSIMSDSVWPMDCSPPGSSVHGILQARILEWVAISFSRGYAQARNQSRASSISRRVLLLLSPQGSRITWATVKTVVNDQVIQGMTQRSLGHPSESFFLTFPSGDWASLIAQLVKNPPANARDPGSIPGLGRSAGEGIGYPLQYSWASPVAQLVKNPPATGRPGFDPWAGKIPWRRERLPTPVFWPGEFHGLYSLWGCKELDMTEPLSLFTRPLN